MYDGRKLTVPFSYELKNLGVLHRQEMHYLSDWFHCDTYKCVDWFKTLSWPSVHFTVTP